MLRCRTKLKFINTHRLNNKSSLVPIPFIVASNNLTSLQTPGPSLIRFGFAAVTMYSSVFFIWPELTKKIFDERQT